MPPNFQIKLLRILQERKLERLGSNKQINLDIWVIAATKVNLERASVEGHFRQDLYYRFNVAELFIPLLAHRQQDILMLFDHFAQKAAYQFEREYNQPSEDDLSSLMEYTWPGNVRQLKNMAERYVLGVGQSRSIRSLLGGKDAANDPQQPLHSLSERMQQYEAQLIIQALQRHKGNITEVMAYLDLPRRTLNNKMIQYDIKRKEFLVE